jgi:hypothetical protein
VGSWFIHELIGGALTKSSREIMEVEELVDRSEGMVRADKVHERLVVMGFGGDERSIRRAIAEWPRRCGGTVIAA